MARKTLHEKFVELLKLNEVSEEKQNGLIQTRLKGIGFSNPCYRCGGSGMYSAFHGFCYRCGGRGHDVFKLTKALYEQAEEKVSAGKLDEYFKEIAKKKKLEKAKDLLFNLMNSNELSSDYTKEYDKERNSRTVTEEGKVIHTYKMNTIIKELRFKQSDLHKEYENLRRELHNKFFLKDRTGKYKNGSDEDRKIAEDILEKKYDEIFNKLLELNTNYENMKKMFMELGNSEE